MSDQNPPTQTQPTSESEATPIVGPDGRVVIDSPCVTCGYNLRTLAESGVCPECATPVRQSTQGFLLSYADPKWVGRVANGLLLTIIGVGGGLGMSVVFLALGLAIAVLASASAPSMGLFQTLSWSVPLVAFAAVLTGAIGLFRLSTPDPRDALATSGLTARRWIRIGLTVVPLLLLTYAAEALINALRPGGSILYVANLIVQILGSVCIIALLAIVPPAVVRHLAELMRRVPRPGLMKFARIVFWAFLGFAGLSILPSALLIFGRSSSVTATATATAISTTMPAGGGLTVLPYVSATGPVVTAQGVSTPATATAPASGPAATSMPTTTSFVASSTSVRGSWMMLVMFGGVAWCGSFAVCIAGFVLLILVRRQLKRTAGLAEANARLPSSGGV